MKGNFFKYSFKTIFYNLFLKDRLGWLTNDNLWCTTHTHSLQLWNCEDASPYNKFDRSNLALSQVRIFYYCLVSFIAKN